jgi:hypothetical protein
MYLFYIFPLSSTHLWLRCSNFFNPSKKNSFGCAANREIGKVKDLSAPLRTQLWTEVFNFHISTQINCNRISDGLLYLLWGTGPEQMNSVSFSETRVNFYLTTRRHIPQESTPNSPCCGNFASHKCQQPYAMWPSDEQGEKTRMERGSRRLLLFVILPDTIDARAESIPELDCRNIALKVGQHTIDPSVR